MLAIFIYFWGLGVQVKKVCLGNLGLRQAKVDPGLGSLLFWKGDPSSTLWLEMSWELYNSLIPRNQVVIS